MPGMRASTLRKSGMSLERYLTRVLGSNRRPLIPNRYLRHLSTLLTGVRIHV